LSIPLRDAGLQPAPKPVSVPGTREGLGSASVLVVGVGALGCPAAAYLAGAGVGVLGLADPATVERAELDGQFLHFAFDVGHNKAERAAAKLGAFNPSLQADAYPALVDERNAEAIVSGHDLVMDCTNDQATTYLLNDACLELKVRFVTGSVRGLAGHLTAVVPPDTPCYRCAFPDADVDETAGEDTAAHKTAASLASPIAGVVGSLQALEAIKLLTGAGEPLAGRVLHVDGTVPSMAVRTYERRPNCEGCR
jgi:molybdopterin/thiamine biosynthesis adenylyltransferase